MVAVAREPLPVPLVKRGKKENVQEAQGTSARDTVEPTQGAPGRALINQAVKALEEGQREREQEWK